MSIGHLNYRALAQAFLAAVLVVGCSAAGPSSKDSKLAYWHLRLGKDYLSKKQAELAKTELLRSVKLDPGSAEAHSLLGVIYFLEGVNAVNFIDRRQCIHGEAADQQRQEANRLFRFAEQHLKSCVQLNKRSKNSAELNYLANVSIHFGRYDEAVAFCDRALEDIMYSDRHVTLGTRGQAFFKKGDLRQAARDLRQSLFHQPKFCVGRFWLAKVLYKKGDYDGAISELERVVADKACPLQEAHQLLGVCYLKKKLAVKAKAQFEECIARDAKSCVSLECQRFAKMI